MSLPLSLLILFVAAFLEVCGDALVRNGLNAPTSLSRIVFFVFGALVLFVYGCVVNSPPWDFSKLLGLYVVFFFIATQLISLLVFHARPSVSTLIGGAFIVVGGAIMFIGDLR
jgi:drug/metabolite transporter superfamily protein YnfA